MWFKIINILRNYSEILKNLSYLTILQVINMVIPLLTYPYLVRVLGGELYGLIIFVLSIMTYLSILLDFGFNVIATKNIAKVRDNKKELSLVVSSVYFIKFCIWIILFISLLLLSYLFSTSSLYLIAFGVCFYEFLFPQWFFQGIEKMKYVTIINLLTKIIFVVIIFSLVRDKEDYLYVPIAYAVVALINGLVGLFTMIVIEKVSIVVPEIDDVKNCAKEAMPIFLSKVVSKFKDQSNTLLIGYFIGMKDVALYDVVNKVVGIINGLLQTVVNVLFPYFSRKKNKKMLKYSFLFVSFMGFFFYLVFLFFGEEIVLILAGSELKSAASLFPVLGLLLLRTSSMFVGNIFMILNGLVKWFNISLVISAVVYFCCFIVMFFLKGESPFVIENFAYFIVVSLLVEYGYRLLICWKKGLFKYML